MLTLIAGYAYAKLPQNFFTGFGPLRGEQGDPAELPPREWPDRDAAGCHILYTASVARPTDPAGAPIIPGLSAIS
jgi:hypothetical protein